MVAGRPVEQAGGRMSNEQGVMSNGFEWGLANRPGNKADE
jgi:hypothetical protein